MSKDKFVLDEKTKNKIRKLIQVARIKFENPGISKTAVIRKIFPNATAAAQMAAKYVYLFDPIVDEMVELIHFGSTYMNYETNVTAVDLVPLYNKALKVFEERLHKQPEKISTSDLISFLIKFLTIAKKEEEAKEKTPKIADKIKQIERSLPPEIAKEIRSKVN